MMNAERNELDHFIERFGTKETIETLAEILKERAEIDHTGDPIEYMEFAERLLGKTLDPKNPPVQVTKYNLIETIEQLQKVATGDLKRYLNGTKMTFLIGAWARENGFRYER